MAHPERRSVVVQAGSSIGRAFIAAVIMTLLWYCFDDRLASLVNDDRVGTLRWTFTFPAAFLLTVLFSVAGMNWKSG